MSEVSTNRDVPLNLPAVRIWDIDENSSHYDKIIAAPSDEEMKLMWVIWSLIMVTVTLFAGFVFTAVILDRKSRKNSFNVYLLGLMIPDILMSLLCGITCWINAMTGHFYSVGLCYFQSVYFTFGIAANSWLNALIARQLFLMLDGAKRFRRYKPPTRKMVIIDALKVYAFSLFVACWGIIDQPWWPHKTGLVLGTACIPIDYSTGSTIFFYCVFIPVLMGIPICYVLYVLYTIKKNDLMPPTGKRRNLALYFARLVAVFIIMWLPAVVFLFIVTAWVHHWLVWAGAGWAHMQGLVSTALSLMKPDIGRAARNLAKTARCATTTSGDEGDDKRSSWYLFGSNSNNILTSSTAARLHGESSDSKFLSAQSGMSSTGGEQSNYRQRITMSGHVVDVDTDSQQSQQEEEGTPYDVAFNLEDEISGYIAEGRNGDANDLEEGNLEEGNTAMAHDEDLLQSEGNFRSENTTAAAEGNNKELRPLDDKTNADFP